MTLPWFSNDLTDLVHPMVAGRVYVVLAPTGTGKTLFGLNTVAHLLEAESHQVMVVATEEAPRYHELLACRAVHVSYTDLFYNRLTGTHPAEVATWAKKYRESEHLIVLPDLEPRLAQVLDAMEGGNVPDLLVIDHLHALNQQGKRLPEFLGTAMSIFAQWATNLRIPILVLAQVNRPQAKDPLYSYRIPTTNAGLGSSKIEHNADVILGLSRKLRDDVPKDVLARLARGLPKRGESLREYEERNTARVTVLKHRMDDEASRRSVLLTVTRGKLHDRLALTGTDGVQGDAFEEETPF